MRCGREEMVVVVVVSVPVSATGRGTVSRSMLRCVRIDAK